MRIRNFGHNVSFSPSRIYRPSSENELLDIVGRHAGDRIRARGSLHSWSAAPATDGVLIEMENFDDVEVSGELHAPRATVGAGCRLERLVEELDSHALALPTNGAVLQQSISGAISTGTHGSGNRSLSSFVKSMRVIALSNDGSPVVHEIDDVPSLLAARCSIGCIGIITRLELDVTHRWNIRERFEHADSLDEVLDGEADWPLQQFFIVPYLWTYYVYRRRKTTDEASWWKSHLYKSWNVVSTDALAHVLFKAVVMLQKAGSNGSVVGFFRHVLPRMLVSGVDVTGDSTLISTVNHHWFRHLEMEIFVPAGCLHRALEIVRELTDFYAGSSVDISDHVLESLDRAGLKDRVLASHGLYAHHYPIFMRRVLHDDTLISMSSPRDDERWWYSISFFSYLQPRTRFFSFVDTILEVLRTELGARPHWGKYHSLTSAELEPLYPNMSTFRQICRRFDPRGMFTNAYTERVLGLGRGDG